MNLNDVGSSSVEPPLHVLILADDLHPNNAVQDHIAAFARHSEHVVTTINPITIRSTDAVRRARIDAIIVHYSIYLLNDYYLNDAWREYLTDFPGVKVMIHEDEYQLVPQFRKHIKAIGFGGLVSCLDNIDTLKAVYDHRELSKMCFYHALPGYISDQLASQTPPPIKGRPLDIVYRGRDLPAQLGRFAQEKRLIGERVKNLAKAEKLKVDISSHEDDRIYGEAWNKFLRSGRAMIGVEGGASIFDLEGKIANKVATYVAKHPDSDFETIWSNVLEPFEGNVVFKTITPKFFEAILNGTALVLYPGEYNGILKPDEHYIALERDGSNFKDVADKIRDDAYLQTLADRARDAIVSNPQLRKSFYVRQIDKVVCHLVERSGRSAPLKNRTADSLSSGTLQILARQLSALARDVSKLGANDKLSGLAQQVEYLSSTALPAFQAQDNAISESLGAISSELTAVRQSLSKLSDEDSRLESASAQLATTIVALKQDVDAIRGSLDQQYARTEEVQGVRAELQADIQKEIETLNGLRDAMREQLYAAINQSAAVLSKEVHEEFQDLKQSIGELGERLTAEIARTRQEATQQIEKHGETLKADFDSRLDSEIADAHREISERTERLDGQLDLSERRAQSAELRAAQLRRWKDGFTAETEEHIAELHKHIDELRAELAELHQTTHSQHHIYTAWKDAVKARIKVVLGLGNKRNGK